MFEIIFFAVILVVVIAAIAANRQPEQPPSPGQTTAPVQLECGTMSQSAQYYKEDEIELYHRFLSMSLGDKDLAERLIRYEARQFPNSSRAELIQCAIDRWERDHNRWR